MPGLLVVGAQKAGTSWVHENLAKHPKIWVPPFKELHFFDHKFIPENRRWTSGHVERGVNKAIKSHLKSSHPTADQLNYLRRIVRRPMFNRQWYRTVFSQCPDSHVGLDVTPEYCCVPPKGLEFIDALLPDARFIYLIRHPVERAVSQIKMNATRRKNHLGTVDDWMRYAQHSVIAHRGDYARYIPQWDAQFSSDRLLYLSFADIPKNPLRVIRMIERFAGLSASLYPALNMPVHASASIDVPTEVLQYLEKLLEAQIAFLIERFGSDFL